MVHISKLIIFYLFIIIYLHLISSAITNYPKIQVSEYGTAYGDDQIMAEIYARGPVSAYIDAVSFFIFFSLPHII